MFIFIIHKINCLSTNYYFVLKTLQNLKLRYELGRVLQSQMGIRKYVKQFIYKCDFFCSAELLRYRQEPEYRTILGGSMSIILMVALVAVFSNKVFDTLNMMSIVSSSSSSNADDPIQLSFDSAGTDRRNFMFGVEIWHHNLNDGVRYFDINLIEMHYEDGEATDQSTQFQLQPCTMDHWKGYPAVQAKFQRLNMHYWLCMPKDLTLSIKGKYSSVKSKVIEISTNRCTNKTGFRPCASQDQLTAFFDQMGNKVFFTIYFVNPLINPDQAEYLTHYMQDRNYMIFSRTGGEQAQLMMSDYTITTDNSISPLEDIIVQTGGIIRENAIKNRYEISETNSNYCTFFLFKSPISIDIKRSFTKLDEILSYIGGLFGTIILLLFVIRIYNSYSFQITIGSSLYKHKDPEELKNYGFMDFIKHMFYAAFKCSLKTSENWSKAKHHHSCREQLLRQMDVEYLLKRINFLERATEVLLDDHHLKGLHLLRKLNLDEAKVHRKTFKMHQRAIEFCENYEGYYRKNTKTTGSSDDPFKTNSPKYKQGNRVGNQQVLQTTLQDLQKKEEIKKNSSKDIPKQDSSSSSDSDDQSPANNAHLHTLDLLLQLKKEREFSSVSRRIYENLSEKIKNFIDKYEGSHLDNEEQAMIQQHGDEQQTYILQNLNKIDFRPRRRYSSLQKVVPLDFHRLIYDQSLQKDIGHFSSEAIPEGSLQNSEK